MTSRATDYDVITASQVASNSSLYILFQYEHHTVYLKSVLFSVSEKETNFSITPRRYIRRRPFDLLWGRVGDGLVYFTKQNILSLDM